MSARKSRQVLKFGAHGLIPAIVQDETTGLVLMMAWMNPQALKLTVKTRRTVFYSRSRKKIWLKGEESGNYQKVSKIYYDCDSDTLLVLVKPAGPACHTGAVSCFFRALDKKGKLKATSEPGPLFPALILTRVYNVILGRKSSEAEQSYVASLYARGMGKILAKVDEEAREFAEAIMDKDEKEVIHETADLWFHMLVALGYRDIRPERVFAELARRFGISGITEKKNRTKKK